MKNLTLGVMMSLFLFSSCLPIDEELKMNELKQEILETEAAFEKMVAEEGIQKAFTFYAADNAVLLRNEKLIMGKNAISNHYENANDQEDISLSWTPEFIDVSLSGDMAYTYGTYLYSFKDKNGISQNHSGVFHTVWKRQKDGIWKYVWD